MPGITWVPMPVEEKSNYSKIKTYTSKEISLDSNVDEKQNQLHFRLNSTYLRIRFKYALFL